MAASGTNEHFEANRKQNVVNRQSYLKQILLNKYGGYLWEEHSQLPEKNVRSRCWPQQLGNFHSHCSGKDCMGHSTDNKSCETRKRPQYLEYSAKINGRFTSTNYSQQW